MKLYQILIVVAFILSGQETFAFTKISLTKYNISDVTVSGLSSGGFMAVQLHIAFSSIFKAAAIFAGGPYYCAQNNDTKSSTDCVIFTKDGPDLPTLLDYTKQFETEGKIDPTSNLNDDQTFVWMGKYDTVVGLKVGESLEEYYKNFVDSSRLHLDHEFPAQHCLPTLEWGVECAKLRPPFIGLCEYDGAGEAFKHFWGSLAPRSTYVEGNLLEFDQTPYIPNSPLASLSDTGYIYFPTSCQSGTTACHLHFSFHGCMQPEAIIGDKWPVHGGYNEWAETNNIIVIYPNTKPSLNEPSNPMGCWDWWGYTGSEYAWKSGVQMQFIRNLITALSGI